LIKSILHRLKGKGKGKTLLTTELIEEKALERVMPQAQEKARGEICQDCRDRRCLKGSRCKEFDHLSKAYAWEMMARSAELN